VADGLHGCPLHYLTRIGDLQIPVGVCLDLLLYRGLSSHALRDGNVEFLALAEGGGRH